MTTREIFDIAVFAVFSLGCFGMEAAMFWDVAGTHAL
jgi:hypothetical protein